MVKLNPLGITVHVEAARELTTVFTANLPSLGQQLQCDRIFLYLRSPLTHLGQVPFCWRRHDDIPLIYDEGWQPEPPSLVQQDPMFAAALQGKPTLYIEDVETASPATLNPAFEYQHFGHRALVHAHIFQADQLWGILQPCVFDHPRQWSQVDQRLIQQTVESMTPHIIQYVRHAVPVTV